CGVHLWSPGRSDGRSRSRVGWRDSIRRSAPDPVTMRSELGESPNVVERLLDRAAASVATVADGVGARGIEVAVIAARGTSDHAAIYAQYVLGARNGLIVAPATPSLSSLYAAPPHLG